MFRRPAARVCPSLVTGPTSTTAARFLAKRTAPGRSEDLRDRAGASHARPHVWTIDDDESGKGPAARRKMISTLVRCAIHDGSLPAARTEPNLARFLADT